VVAPPILEGLRISNIHRNHATKYCRLHDSHYLKHKMEQKGVKTITKDQQKSNKRYLGCLEIEVRAQRACEKARLGLPA
jgi:hypothetical protein